MTDALIENRQQNQATTLGTSECSIALASIPENAQIIMRRMFADPRVLDKQEKEELVALLGECVEQYPTVSELRVLYGMALCVNLEVQDAMEELAEAVSLAPDSFIAHLKMGELWMRLRVCEKAKDHTHQAVLLAQNLAQSELARRQAAALRTMMREGIERGGYSSPWHLLGRLRRLWTRNRGEELAPAEAQ